MSTKNKTHKRTILRTVFGFLALVLVLPISLPIGAALWIFSLLIALLSLFLTVFLSTFNNKPLTFSYGRVERAFWSFPMVIPRLYETAFGPAEEDEYYDPSARDYVSNFLAFILSIVLALVAFVGYQIYNGKSLDPQSIMSSIRVFGQEYTEIKGSVLLPASDCGTSDFTCKRTPNVEVQEVSTITGIHTYNLKIRLCNREIYEVGGWSTKISFVDANGNAVRWVDVYMPSLLPNECRDVAREAERDRHRNKPDFANGRLTIWDGPNDSSEILRVAQITQASLR